MLIRFRLKNFTSYNEEQVFTMIPGKAKTHSERIIKDNNLKLLNFAAIYGANASGKSNFAKAIDTAQKIILNGLTRACYSEMYCKAVSGNEKKDTKFEFEIKIKNRVFAYGFFVRMNDLEITGEWLFELFDNEEKNIFSYYKTEIQYNDQYFLESNSEFKIYLNDIVNMKDKLLLADIVSKNKKGKDYKIFKDIFEWFEIKKLSVIFPESEIGPIHSLFDEKCKVNTLELLKYFDTGIAGYTEKKLDIDEIDSIIPRKILNRIFMDIKKKIKKSETKNLKGSEKDTIDIFTTTNNRVIKMSYNTKTEEITEKELLFYHGKNKDITYSLKDESDGTKRLIQLLSMFNRLDDDTLFIVDELDRSFHPKMVHKFVETFLNLTQLNKTRTQMIITTHESTLMDLKVLRRDEIWFVERDENYTSKLYSLDEYKVRNDKDVRKDYLWGRYGAVPVFDDFEFYKMKIGSENQGNIEDDC